MQRDSLANTIFISVSVCLVCSFLVTAAAVGLRPYQEENARVDIMKNILSAAGVSKDEMRSNEKVKQLFSEKVEVKLIDLRTGTQVTTEEEKAEFVAAVQKEGQELEYEEALANFDPIKAADDPNLNEKLGKKEDVAGLKTLENYSKIYTVPSDEGVTYVFPIRGRGLWSTLKGFMALSSDLNTVKGLTYYEHAETPGLGGEVDNPSWKETWQGKELYKDGDVKLQVVKGTADTEYEIDGLAGATITSNGVSNMVAFWFSNSGFKNYIEAERKK